MTQPDPTSDLQVLRTALRQWIAPQDPGRDTDSPNSEEIAWPSLLDLAEASKCLLLAEEGLRRLGIAVPDRYRSRVDEARRFCLTRNMANLATTARVCAMLRTHGIDTLSLKGVLRARALYDRWDVRLAHDTDILVRDEDYWPAVDVLRSNGFSAPIPPESKWWHGYLGESPFVPDGPGSVIVDLHRKLNQPGTPAPGDFDRLFVHSRREGVGEREVSVLGEMDAAMLTASSLGKALRNNERWLLHAHELMMVSGRLTDERSRDYDRHARDLGMERLWRHAVAMSRAIFPTLDPTLDEESGPRGSDMADELMRLAVGSARPDRIGYKRSALLWRWTDGSVRRPLRFAREFAQVVRAEMRHDYEERQGGYGP